MFKHSEAPNRPGCLKPLPQAHNDDHPARPVVECHGQGRQPNRASAWITTTSPQFNPIRSIAVNGCDQSTPRHQSPVQWKAGRPA
jgi:hypothetical protein